MVVFLECPNVTTEKLFEKVKFSKLSNPNLQKNCISCILMLRGKKKTFWVMNKQHKIYRAYF